MGAKKYTITSRDAKIGLKHFYFDIRKTKV